MKKFCILFFFVIKSLSSEAQTSIYHPFPDSAAVWNQTLGWISGSCDITQYSSIFFGVDTIIGAFIYHKLKESGFSFSSSCGGGGYFYYDSIALIRQDTSLKRVYYYFAGTDTILYDFDLHVGDTLNASKVHWGNYFGDMVRVTSIDSILIFGNYRKRFNFNKFDGGSGFNGCPDTSIIEGISATAGMFAIPDDCFESFARLTCFSNANDTGAMCSIISNIKFPEKNNSSVTIFPNPAQTSATLFCNFPVKNAEIIISDSFGRSLYRRKIIVSSSEIEVQTLPKGIYFYQFINEERQFSNGKLIIE